MRFLRIQSFLFSLAEIFEIKCHTAVSVPASWLLESTSGGGRRRRRSERGRKEGEILLYTAEHRRWAGPLQ